MKKEKQKDREDRQICIVFATALLACALFTGCGAAKEDNLSQGIALVEQMDYEGALTCFEAAALNKEDMRQVYRGQGLAYMGMTDYENAAASFEKALGQSSPRPDAMDYDINYYLATAYYRNGQVDKAIHVYQAITDLKPGEKTAWYLKGTMELEQGSTDAAKSDFDKAVEAAPNDYDIRIDFSAAAANTDRTILENPIWKMFWTATGSGFRISISAESATTWAIMSRPVPLWKRRRKTAVRKQRLCSVRPMRHSVITIMRRVSITPTCRTKRRTRLCTISSGFAN